MKNLIESTRDGNIYVCTSCLIQWQNKAGVEIMSTWGGIEVAFIHLNQWLINISVNILRMNIVGCIVLLITSFFKFVFNFKQIDKKYTVHHVEAVVNVQRFQQRIITDALFYAC